MKLPRPKGFHRRYPDLWDLQAGQAITYEGEKYADMVNAVQYLRRKTGRVFTTRKGDNDTIIIARKE